MSIPPLKTFSQFHDDLRVLTEHQISSALNQCYTGEKYFPLHH